MNFGRQIDVRWTSVNCRAIDVRVWMSSGCSIYIHERLDEFWTTNKLLMDVLRYMGSLRLVRSKHCIRYFILIKDCGEDKTFSSVYLSI